MRNLQCRRHVSKCESDQSTYGFRLKLRAVCYTAKHWHVQNLSKDTFGALRDAGDSEY